MILGRALVKTQMLISLVLRILYKKDFIFINGCVKRAFFTKARPYDHAFRIEKKPSSPYVAAFLHPLNIYIYYNLISIHDQIISLLKI